MYVHTKLHQTESLGHIATSVISILYRTFFVCTRARFPKVCGLSRFLAEMTDDGRSQDESHNSDRAPLSHRTEWLAVCPSRCRHGYPNLRLDYRPHVSRFTEHLRA